MDKEFLLLHGQPTRVPTSVENWFFSSSCWLPPAFHLGVELWELPSNPCWNIIIQVDLVQVTSCWGSANRTACQGQKTLLGLVTFHPIPSSTVFCSLSLGARGYDTDVSSGEERFIVIYTLHFENLWDSVLTSNPLANWQGRQDLKDWVITAAMYLNPFPYI